MRRTLILILLTGIILSGICLFMFPLFWEKTVIEQNNNIIKEMKDISSATLEENKNKVAEYDFSQVEDINAIDIFKEKKQWNPNYAIGIIKINSIHLCLPIMKGISNSNLNIGTATMKEKQEMGKGNYALAGHYNPNADILFGGIMNIKIGDIILITDKTDIYEYKVYQTKVVKDDEIIMITDEIARTRGKPVISLMTCYYSSKTGKRYFVIGEYVNKYPFIDTIFQNDIRN